MAFDDDIDPMIQGLLPPEEASALFQQIVDRDIERDGGVKKSQKSFDEIAAQTWGIEMYDNMPPSKIEAYQAAGVVLPATQPKTSDSPVK